MILRQPHFPNRRHRLRIITSEMCWNEFQIVPRIISYETAVKRQVFQQVRRFLQKNGANCAMNGEKSEIENTVQYSSPGRL